MSLLVHACEGKGRQGQDGYNFVEIIREKEYPFREKAGCLTAVLRKES
jgi:hypothetical protein